MSVLKINMLSKADSVDGQGVGSAYIEQVALVKESTDLFDISINGKGRNYDIYHIHSVNPSFYFKLKHRKKHSVFVTYVHFLPTTLDGSIKLSKGIFSIFKNYVISVYRKSDEIVVVNPIFIEPLVQLGINQDNITYIPNYVSKDTFYKLPDDNVIKLKQKYNISENKFVVLGVGQIQTRKGVNDFIEVAKMNPDIEFVWAGGFSFGVITDGYKELKEKVDNPPSNVKFLGIIPRAHMNEIYNISNCLFMPSYNELFPMSILEAVNTKIPVVLRDLDLYKDILFEKYEKGNDNEEFSKIIRKLKDDPEEYQKSVDDSIYISSYYSKENVSKLWREYYPRIYNKYKNVKK